MDMYIPVTMIQHKTILVVTCDVAYFPRFLCQSAVATIYTNAISNFMHGQPSTQECERTSIVYFHL